MAEASSDFACAFLQRCCQPDDECVGWLPGDLKSCADRVVLQKRVRHDQTLNNTLPSRADIPDDGDILPDLDFEVGRQRPVEIDEYVARA